MGRVCLGLSNEHHVTSQSIWAVVAPSILGRKFTGKICLVSCIRPVMGDEYCTWFDDFDGLMVTFRASKTDQYNEGCKRYLGHTDNSMCAVKAFRDWVELQPGWFRNAPSNDRPMFSLPDGRVLGRCEVQLDYREAAAALGLPTENIGNRSCRVLCATWMYQAGCALGW